VKVEIVVELPREVSTRIDTLAAQRNITRDEMMVELIQLGLDEWKREGMPRPPSGEADEPR
jgi:hypothetical protein